MPSKMAVYMYGAREVNESLVHATQMPYWQATPQPLTDIFLLRQGLYM